MSIQPVVPTDASTIILVKPIPVSPDTPSSWDPRILSSPNSSVPFLCFMVRRHVRSEFAADVFVFPGGKVDPADDDPQLIPYVRSVEDLHATDGDSSVSWLGLKMAAIRELFEEAGVLLAQRAGQALRFGSDNEQAFATYRQDLHAGRLSMLELAQKETLTFDLDLLYHFSRWITPLTAPRRYDTRFFIAEMPPGQEPLHDAVETTDSAWIGPREALERYRSGGFPLVYATEKHLEQLARYASLGKLITATEEADMTPVVPRGVERNGQEIFLLPGELGYEEADPFAAFS